MELLVGDVDFENVKEKVLFYNPVPMVELGFDDNSNAT